MKICPLGESPDLGVVPEQMHASLIRPERYGEPRVAFAQEVVDTPKPGPGQVLVQIMASGINYNNVWAALGTPIDVIGSRQRRTGDTDPFHIGGSEASGVVWAVGDGVREREVGDEVILSSCHWDEGAPDIRLGTDQMTSTSQTVWGYEDNFGSFAQFSVVDEYQCIPKPPSLTWEEASCFMLTGATAYRQLHGWEGHTVRPGDPVLIWGGAGGLGSMAIQIVAAAGGKPVAVVSSEDKFDYCRKLGAVGVINRNDYSHWGRLPDLDDAEAMKPWMTEVRRFGKAFWDALGERKNPRIVFEHSGQATIPTSIYLCDNGGMVVVCGGTSGYNGDVDLRFLWMRQKRLQGSHFANVQQCHAITHLIAAGHVDPCLSWTGEFAEVGEAHQLMRDNIHPHGNMAVLVNAPRKGLKTLADHHG
ncbi:MAG: crotonyl-CoA carboxylase/reductase [bacterium]|nr:crotonyl-CoA carboxylase/reductase [bacterium]